MEPPTIHVWVVVKSSLASLAPFFHVHRRDATHEIGPGHRRNPNFPGESRNCCRHIFDHICRDIEILHDIHNLLIEYIHFISGKNAGFHRNGGYPLKCDPVSWKIPTWKKSMISPEIIRYAQGLCCLGQSVGAIHLIQDLAHLSQLRLWRPRSTLRSWRQKSAVFVEPAKAICT